MARYPVSLCTVWDKNLVNFSSVNRGGSRIFFWRGCTTTSIPINHILFLLQNTSCIRKPQVILEAGVGGGVGGAHPLHPPLRPAPGLYLSDRCCIWENFCGINLGIFLAVCYSIYGWKVWFRVIGKDWQKIILQRNFTPKKTSLQN